MTADFYHNILILQSSSSWQCDLNFMSAYVKSIINTINEVIHEKYDRFIYLDNHFPLLSIDFRIM